MLFALARERNLRLPRYQRRCPRKRAAYFAIRPKRNIIECSLNGHQRTFSQQFVEELFSRSNRGLATFSRPSPSFREPSGAEGDFLRVRIFLHTRQTNADSRNLARARESTPSLIGIPSSLAEAFYFSSGARSFVPPRRLHGPTLRSFTIF